MLAEDPMAHFSIRQDLPYEGRPALPLSEALGMLLKKMEQTGREELAGHTSLYVVPGYRFRVAQGLITNFHQPKSTLLLLISAFVGPAWKSLYNQALERDYRFLSYGDSSLLLPPNI
jgi:S-adenosylmethionine:tRNA ribosyltransferase-isomerase